MAPLPPGKQPPNAAQAGPLGIGMMLTVLVYAGGHISGAHYNPAVTTACMITGKINVLDSIGYYVVQLLGGIVGALYGWFNTHNSHCAGKTYPLPGCAIPQPAKTADGEWNTIQAVLAELFYSFVLCFCVLNVAATKRTEGNSFYGLAIGFTVGSGALVVGAISGAVFNPAVGLGLTMKYVFTGAATHGGAMYLKWLPLYLGAPLIGACIAGGCYVMCGDDTLNRNRGLPDDDELEETKRIID